MGKPMVTFESVTAEKETDMALLCCIDGNQVWIPKTQIGADSEVNDEGDHGTLEITEWIAQEKDLI